MADYVFVHGAWQGAWGWERVRTLLESQGHGVLAVDLPGHGQLVGWDPSQIRLQDYVDAVVEQIRKNDLQDVILVGHSLAGITVPSVASRMRERIERLVFISCMLPLERSSALEMLQPLDRFLFRLVKTLARGRRRGVKIPAFLARRKLCTGMDQETTEWFLQQLVPDPVGPWEERVSWEGLSGDVPKTYIVLTEDRALPPPKQRLMLLNLGEPEVVELGAGHNAMLTQPGELAEILLRYA